MTDEYSFRIRRIVQWTIFVLAGSIFAWGMTPYKPWFGGLALGTGFALLSALFTAWKIHKVGNLAIQHKDQKKRPSIGTPTRFALAALSTLVAMRYPQHFRLAAMVIGLMVPTMIAFIDMLYYSLMDKSKEKNAEEGGE